jgi:hypothetical protein
VTVAYFIRRAALGCAVVELGSDDRERIVQDGMSLLEAEILCAAKIADIQLPAPAQDFDHDVEPRHRIERRRDPRQLTLRF